MANYATALVVVEAADGQLSALSNELLTAARSLSDRVEAVTWVDGASIAEQAGRFGAAAVHQVDVGDRLPGAPVAAAIGQYVQSLNGRCAVLVGTSYDGRDIVGRLSSRLDVPVLTNVVGLMENGDNVVAEHAVFGGATLVHTAFRHDGVALFAVRPKSFVAESIAGGAAAVVNALPVPELGRTNEAAVVEHRVEEHAGPKLDAAAVVVAGGRGLGAKENFDLIEQLAKALGGAPAASRAIVDAGWVPYSYQVGQTGKTVKPDVYMAVGISGATQHLVGMKGAKRIIAINSDPDAPIFKIADLGIVGDAKQILSRLLAALLNV